MWDRTLLEQSRWSAANVRRRGTARELAAMANGGDCPEAIRRAVALEEWDMAHILYDACRRPDAPNARIFVGEPEVAD